MHIAVRLLLILLLVVVVLVRPSLAIGEDIPLLEFKEGLRNTSALDATWRTNTHPCQDRWRGIDCEEGGGHNVSALILANLGLTGVSQDIDVESLSLLRKLRVVSLENNSFSGPIPEFNRLTSLRALFLYGNQFVGEIPQDFFNNMRSLKKLDLGRNRFSGPIPTSIAGLVNLDQLSLEENMFSGHVPLIAQGSLKEMNMSYNRLEGEIPATMARFGPKCFEGNPGVCGSPISRPCEQAASPEPASEDQNSSGTKWVILIIVVSVLVITLFFNKAKKKEDSFHVLGQENVQEIVQLQVHQKSRSSSRKGSSRYGEGGGAQSSSRRGGSSKGSSDLMVVNEERGVFGLQDLMKAAAEVLGSGGVGSAYKALMSNGVSVVVKRFRDMNKLNKDAFDAEVRRFGRIRHMNILPPLAYHYRREEKLLVSEFVPNGSLMFLLHGDRGQSHTNLTWPVRLKIIKGVARGLGFLHTEFSNYELPHGNLKSSNILLSANYEPLLTDYALYALLSNSLSTQALFAYKSPEAVLYQQVSPKSDVYCLGVVILETMTGKYPSQYLNNQKGGTDVVQWVRQALSEDRIVELIDPELTNNAEGSLDQMEKMMCIGAACTETDHGDRIEMREAIRSIDEVQAT